MAYLTLDDPNELRAALSDPARYVETLPLPAVLDEAQRAKALFLPLKARIDRERRPGMILLTGSANLRALPEISDALVGRVLPLRLWPLAQAELQKNPFPSLDWLHEPPTRLHLEPTPWESVELGGFPPVVLGAPRDAWFQGYLETLFYRDVRTFANLTHPESLFTLIAMLAHQAGGILNQSSLARETGLPLTTTKRYLAALEGLFLTWKLPPWHKNPRKRLTKSPKSYLVDSGLAAYLLGPRAPGREGKLWETFIANELMRTIDSLGAPYHLYFYREASGLEVDFLLEDTSGHLYALEAKARKTLSAKDFAPLRRLKERFPDRLKTAGVLYPGERLLPFGDGLWAFPASLLWSR